MIEKNFVLKTEGIFVPNTIFALKGVPNADRFFYYRGNVGNVKNAFVIVSKRSGLILAYGQKLAQAVVMLKDRLAAGPIDTRDEIERFEFFKTLFVKGISEVVIRVGLSSAEALDGVFSVAFRPMHDPTKFVFQLVEHELEHSPSLGSGSPGKVGVIGFSIYRNREDATYRTNCLYTHRYTAANSRKSKNLLYGYRFKAAVI